MSIILFEKRLSLRDFYIRRLSRVFPLLLVLVTVMFSVAAITSKTFTVAEIPAALLFIRTYYPETPHIWSTVTSTAHLWSLNVEEHAYLLLSAFTLLMTDTRKVALTLLSLAAISMAISFYYYATTATPAEFELKSIQTESAASFIFFSAGYALLKRRYDWQLPAVMVLLLIIFAAACYSYAFPLWCRFSFSLLALGVTVNHLNTIPGWLRQILTHNVTRWFGFCSYSLYMWQQVFFEHIWAIPGGRISALALCLCTGAASYYLFEDPVRHKINKRWSAQPVYH